MFYLNKKYSMKKTITITIEQTKSQLLSPYISWFIQWHEPTHHRSQFATQRHRSGYLIVTRPTYCNVLIPRDWSRWMPLPQKPEDVSLLYMSSTDHQYTRRNGTAIHSATRSLQVSTEVALHCIVCICNKWPEEVWPLDSILTPEVPSVENIDLHICEHVITFDILSETRNQKVFWSDIFTYIWSP
jgi:hypothetical protein